MNSLGANHMGHSPVWVTASTLRAVIASTIFAIGIPAFAWTNGTEQPAHSAQGAAQIFDQEELLWWLPADTESVVAARGPFPVRPHSSDEKDDEQWFTKKASLSEIRLEFEQLPLELFISLDLDTVLRGSTVALAMQGSRHFRDPLPSLEVMDFEGCSIVIFENDLGKRGERLMRELSGRTTRQETVAETTVLVFHDKLEQAEWDLFLALPRPNVLLVANNLPYLREVLERMAQRRIDRALPSHLPEWRFLDPGVRYWGLRHYDRTQAEQDATSPFSEERTFGPGDQKAIGILFTLDPGNQKEAVMTYFSGNEAKVRDRLNAGTSCEEGVIASSHEVITRDGGMSCEVEEPQDRVKYQVRLRSPAPGILERIYPLDRSSTLDYFILNEVNALGRGMYF
jgi:hypothetical protein